MNSSVESSIFDLILNSSLFTKTILFILFSVSVISWGIMIHRFFYVYFYKSDISNFLKSLTAQSNPSFIEESCMRFSKGSARLMPVLILKMLKAEASGKTIQSPETLINNAVMQEHNQLQKGMGMLATTANVSPLLGLLGTVWGITYSFINIHKLGNASIGAVAPGIAEALVATIFGLVVAIPATVGHNLLSVSINHCLDSLDRVSEFAKSLFVPKEI